MVCRLGDTAQRAKAIARSLPLENLDPRRKAVP
jgi:hypothetical protein